MSARLNPVSIFALGLIIGLALGYLGRPLVAPTQPAVATATLTTGFPPEMKPSPSPSPSWAEPSWDSAEGLIARVRHFKGDPQAPVVMIEFGDFQCPFCGRFARTTAPLIEEAYIRSGKVRFGYLHFAFLGPESTWAAQASECAAEQEAFWAYHDLLYARQAGENQGAFSRENLDAFAEELGLNVDAFRSCLRSGRYADVVADDSSLARAMGVSGTPTFWINGERLVGALPFEAFAEVIDRALETSGQ